jgi:4-hydroxy-tetrahydrodipicolinate synthase
MKAGYVPALGTPLDANGNLCEESFRKQIEDQINAGAVALLCMGTMGIQAYIRQEVCPQVAKVAVDAAMGRVPVFVGAMDISIARAKERIAAMEELPDY